jgi:uncharacterized protein (TIGR00369 family)
MNNDVFERFENLTGLEFIRSLAGDLPQVPMHETFGIRVVSADEGIVELVGAPSEKFYNPMRRLHGGFAATLIDSALGAAVMTKLGKGIGCGTVDLKVSYVKRIDVNVGELVCRANVLHAGRTMFTAEAKLVDREEKLYAHGTGTFLVYAK